MQTLKKFHNQNEVSRKENIEELLHKPEKEVNIQISNPSDILPIIDEIIANNPNNVAKFKAGNNKLMGFFVGQVLKGTGEKANPQIVNKLVGQQLNQ